MRLVSCFIENFGALHQEEISFSPGVTMISRENGWGKSTLAAFIKVMFYGFENERSRDPYQNERKRYAPWQGGTYGGTVQFIHKGKEYVLTRTFGSKEREDRYSLREAATNLETKDFSASLGMELFHLDSASFQRTMFLTQMDCKTYGTDGIHAKLGNLVDHTHDISNYEAADQRLNGILNAMSPTRKTGELYKKKEELSYLEMEMKEIPQVEKRLLRLQQEEKEKKACFQKVKLQQRYGTLLEQYQIKKQEKDQAENYFRVGMIQEKDGRNPTLKERNLKRACDRDIFLEEWIPKEEEIKEQLNRCADWKATKKMLSYLSEERKEKQKEIPELEEIKPQRRWMDAISILFLFLGVILFFQNKIVATALFLSGLGLFWWNRRSDAACKMKHNRKEVSQEETDSKEKETIKKTGASKKREHLDTLYQDTWEKEKIQRESLLDFLQKYGFTQEEDYQESLLELLSHVQRYQGAKRALLEAEEAIDRLEGDQEVSDIDDLILPEDSTLEEITDQMETLGRELLQIERDRESLLKRREMLEEKELFYQEEKERYQKRWEQYMLLEKTRKYLSEAKVSFTAKYRNPIQKGFGKYFTWLTGESGEGYQVDANLNVTKKEAGLQRESRFFSAGYQDLMGICMRMALLDAMYPGEKPFLVLDDPFVNLDTEKTKKGLHMIEKIAKEYQVVYFTCHEGRGLYVK